MRIQLAAAIAATIVAAFAAKLLLFGNPPTAADTHAATASTISIPQLQIEHPNMEKQEVKEPF